MFLPEGSTPFIQDAAIPNSEHRIQRPKKDRLSFSPADNKSRPQKLLRRKNKTEAPILELEEGEGEELSDVMRRWFSAVKDGDVAAVAEILEDGEINVDEQSPVCQRLISLVMSHGRHQSPAIRLFVQHFLNIDDKGNTPHDLMISPLWRESTTDVWTPCIKCQ